MHRQKMRLSLVRHLKQCKFHLFEADHGALCANCANCAEIDAIESGIFSCGRESHHQVQIPLEDASEESVDEGIHRPTSSSTSAISVKLSFADHSN
jgi:hypothetical protein